MSTKQSTIDYLLDQLVGMPDVSARKMFGEYALYVGTKVVALVCDDTLFVKITDGGKEYIGGKYQEGFAYKGAKISMQISEDLIEDREWLSGLIEITARELPERSPKRKRSVSTPAPHSV
jgi:TfoX/Sxy family transcriptional regulator of competence genes